MASNYNLEKQHAKGKLLKESTIFATKTHFMKFIQRRVILAQALEWTKKKFLMTV